MRYSCVLPTYFVSICQLHQSIQTLQEDQTAAELALSRAQLFPLKKENARLLRDNNLLHLKVSWPGSRSLARMKGGDY